MKYHEYCYFVVSCSNLVLLYTGQYQIQMNLRLLLLQSRQRAKRKRSLLKRKPPFLCCHLTALQWAQEAKGWILLALQWAQEAKKEGAACDPHVSVNLDSALCVNLHVSVNLCVWTCMWIWTPVNLHVYVNRFVFEVNVVLVCELAISCVIIMLCKCWKK